MSMNPLGFYQSMLHFDFFQSDKPADFTHLPEVDEFEGYEKNNLLFELCGLDVAALGLSEDREPYFMYNWKFDGLTQQTKDFLFYHELGHYKLGHIDGLAFGETMERDIEVEFDADYYASLKIGRWAAIRRLAELMKVAEPLAYQEIIARILYAMIPRIKRF